MFFLHGSVPQTYIKVVCESWSFILRHQCIEALWPWNLILALWASMIKVTKLLDKCSQCRRVHCESMPDIKLNLIFPPLVTVSEFLDVSQQDFWSNGPTPSCDWTEPGISFLFCKSSTELIIISINNRVSNHLTEKLRSGMNVRKRSKILSKLFLQNTYKPNQQLLWCHSSGCAFARILSDMIY